MTVRCEADILIIGRLLRGTKATIPAGRPKSEFSKWRAHEQDDQGRTPAVLPFALPAPTTLATCATWAGAIKAKSRSGLARVSPRKRKPSLRATAARGSPLEIKERMPDAERVLA
jgi:hypothetical protein